MSVRSIVSALSRETLLARQPLNCTSCLQPRNCRINRTQQNKRDSAIKSGCSDQRDDRCRHLSVEPPPLFGVPCVPIRFQCPFAALTTDLSNDRKSSRESLRVVPVTAVRRLRCKRAGALPEPRAASTTGADKGAHSGPTARVQRKRISMGSEPVQK